MAGSSSIGDATTRDPIPRRKRPDEPTAPYLVAIGGELAGLLYPLEGVEAFVIGRNVECHAVIVLDEYVSRRHAAIAWGGTAYRLQHLGGKGETFLNGSSIEKEEILRAGDRISVGADNVFRLEWLGADEAAQRRLGALDALTGCFNRSTLYKRGLALFDRAAERGRPLALLLADIDHFKALNDGDPGHYAAGDCVLRGVVAAMQAALAATSSKGRMYRRGGEEFVALVPDTDAASAIACAEAMRVAVRDAEFPFEGRILRATVSLGVALHDPAHALDILFESLERRADAALVRAKREGRDRVIPA